MERSAHCQTVFAEVKGAWGDEGRRDTEIPVAIARAMNSNPTLRSKKDLIERFLETLSPDSEADRAKPPRPSWTVPSAMALSPRPAPP
ncbi:MAG: hypothetical protein LBT54_01715 [Bifidobacteriaceae bacterium]|nr:hypothetical protein [Bifidobacteriaceae bacterium]